MRNLIIIYLLFITCQLFPQSPFTKLSGFEDKNGNTHLYYTQGYVIGHLDIAKGTDEVFLQGFGGIDGRYPAFGYIDSFDFWNNDPYKYIYCYDMQDGLYINGSIIRYNGERSNGPWAYNISISKQNGSLLYVGLQGTSVSIDSGLSWTNISYTYSFLSLSPFNDNIIFVTNYGSSYNLYRSIDRGQTFSLVDTSNYYGSNFVYDIDSLHIYVTRTTVDSSKLSVSNSRGDSSSWQGKYFSKNNIYITTNNSKSGTVYLADGKNIFVSNDYGNSFNIYKTLDSVIVGLYKKPNSDILYVITANDIFETTSSSNKSIKHIVTAVKKDNLVLTKYELYQNYPNPFNPSTTINYSLPKSGLVTLKVYDILGREVKTLVNTYKAAGSYDVSFNASNLASGIYIYQLKSGNFVSTKKLVLLK
jgi:hypothetical protein